ncbi:hypothetical protein B7P43_G03436 [Cryptotermes secundus]|uniref:Mos1 transposase HTH domain-containing protein n=1 Tax=Cryptotermes secundus TaxID=105785 RepID=A0A2J7RLI5_9NEOP|nr:hypothetical protein B7P43_G03436 [Cryptotermes secundus]
MLKKAYGEDCLSCTKCYEWYQRFKSGRMSTEDNHKPGQPFTSTDNNHVEEVRPVIRENRRLTVSKVSEEVGISRNLYTQFWPKNWRCIMLLQNLCHVDRRAKSEPCHGQSVAV